MKIVISLDKNPTEAELQKIEEKAQMLIDDGFTVELIGTRPNDR